MSALLLTFNSAAAEVQLSDSPSRDKRVLKRWIVPGSPRGVALAADGTLYAGLSERQSIAAIDPRTGRIQREVVLDSEAIAATKELVTLRLDAPRKRIIAANGSDESVSILSVPELAVLREITLEGEVVRDAIADPQGRFLYILGRAVHVWDAEGEREIISIPSPAPMAIAVSASGHLLAIVGSDEFESGRATVVALYDPASLKEIARKPLQTDREIQAALFAAEDRSLVVVAQDWLAEKPLDPGPEKKMSTLAPRISVDFGDLVSSDQVCLAKNSGPQILVTGRKSSVVHFVERRCSHAGSAFDASTRKVTWSSVYGVPGWAAEYDARDDSLWVSDPAGFITQYTLAKEDR